MANSMSELHRVSSRRAGAFIKVAIAAACLSFTAAPSFAGSKVVPESKVSVEKKAIWPQARNKVRVSGSAYVCMPSGFGQKGRCVLRASML